MREKVSKPALVSDPSQVDEHWLTDALRYAGVLGDARIAAVERERVGTGLVGQNVAFTITYDRPAPGAPASVVGKFPSPEAQSRTTAKTLRLFEREVRFYQEIAATVDIRIPACHFAEIDPETCDFILLLEDLRPARQGDQVAGCTVEEAALAMDELAALHAPRLGDPSLATIDWLGQYDNPQSHAMVQAMYNGVWTGFVETYRSVLTPEALALGESFGASTASWQRSWQRPWCVTHGDYRLDNMLFGTDQGRYPLAVVDWQTVGHGPGILDAAYFIGNALPIPERREHESSLLRRYYDQLSNRGVKGYGWDQCRADYKRATLAGVLMTVVASQVVATDARGREMFSVMAERHFAHALDHRAGEVLS
jgi:hypothetical protein